MKTMLKYSLMMLAAVLGVACNDMIESSEPTVDIERTIILTATREGTDPNTRSVRMDDGTTWWSPKEEISVFYGSGSNGGSKFTSNNTTLAETTEFEGSISMSGNKEFWAVYPYSTENSCDGSSIVTVIPSQQTGSEGNFSGDAFPAIGKSSSLTMPFWNICGGIKFFVSRTDIQSVTIKGNNGETLAGEVKVAFNAEGKPEVAEVLDGQTEVTLIAPDGGSFKPGKYYYITLLPTVLEGGITLTFNTSFEKGEIVSDKPQTVERSVFGVLKNIDSKVSEWETVWVDLGLSVKWATCNVGASKPEEYGDFFAWGETEPKDDYSWSTYKWCNGPGNGDNLIKYCTGIYKWDSSEPMDNKTVLDPEDDAAHVILGGKWRMPTATECDELINNCTWTWTVQNGVNGRLVTAPNGNSIFLPAAGSRYTTLYDDAGHDGGYWISSLDISTSFSDYAYRVYFNSDDVYGVFDCRFCGLSVRPVYGEFVPVSSVSINQSNIDLEPNATFQLSASIAPSNATAPGIRWVSSDESIASVNQSGIVTGISAGTATITAYASNGLSASCLFSISSGQIFSIESWELNPDLIVGAMDRLNKNRPASEAYYGNEPYKTYGGIGLYNPASEDDRTSLIEHFRDYSACWKNANVESNYTFKVINYKNTIVDIVGSGTNTSFGADANGCAFVTMPGADLIGIAKQTLLSPDILFRKPDGLQAGKDVLIEVSESINGQEMKGYYYLVPNAVSRNQIEFTGQGAELGAFHDSNDYILVHELMPIIYKNGKEIIKWNSSSQSWTITSEGQSLGLKDAGLISVRINYLIFDKNEKDSEDSFKGRLSIFKPGDYITPYPYPEGSVSEAGIDWWNGDLAALMSDKIAGYKMAVYYYGLDNPLVTTIEGEVKVLASGKKEHPYHHPDGTWWN